MQKLWSEALGDPDVLSIMGKVREVFRTASTVAPKKFPHDDRSYSVTFVGRKVVLALLATGRVAVDWATMTKAQLEDLCCDQGHFLGNFDASMSAADVSNVVFGRRDWPMFVSLWGCLMKDVFRNTSSPPSDLIKTLRSQDYAGVSAELRDLHGHAVHPALVLQELHRRQT